jgi:hypothetical protein
MNISPNNPQVPLDSEDFKYDFDFDAIFSSEL